jgi:hypothetical protein
VTIYGLPKSNKELQDQIEFVCKDIRDLLYKLPSSKLTDELSRHFYFLERRLDLSNIELKKKYKPLTTRQK